MVKSILKPNTSICSSPSINQTLWQLAEPFELNKRELLLDASQPWRHCYWLQNGFVRMYYLDREGREHNKAFFTEGDLFWPVTERLRTQPVEFYIETITSVHGFLWSFEDYKQAFSDPLVWYEFSQFWMERLLNGKLQREHDLLQLSASERYLKLCQQQPGLVSALTDSQLASYIGITPVSLSRLKKSLTVIK